jgi:dihydroflavonol-4-reductase
LVGRKPPTIQLPRELIFPVAYIMEMLARLTGRTPFVTVDELRMAKKKMFFSTAKAERELGYKARPAKQAIADALAWFRDKGYC